MDNVLPLPITTNHMSLRVFPLAKLLQAEEALKAKSSWIVSHFGLEKEADTLAKNFSLQQRHLEIVRALATEPKSSSWTRLLQGWTLRNSRIDPIDPSHSKEFNITIMLIEHDMSLVMEVTERIYVLGIWSLDCFHNARWNQNNELVIIRSMSRVKPNVYVKSWNLSGTLWHDPGCPWCHGFEVNEGKLFLLSVLTISLPFRFGACFWKIEFWVRRFKTTAQRL